MGLVLDRESTAGATQLPREDRREIPRPSDRLDADLRHDDWIEVNRCSDLVWAKSYILPSVIAMGKVIHFGRSANSAVGKDATCPDIGQSGMFAA